MRRIDTESRSISAAEKLFLELLDNLNRPNALYEAIPMVLEKICAFFSFGGAFVYELDHTRAFHLKEYYETYENHAMREQFLLEELFSKPEQEALYANPTIFYSANSPAHNAGGVEEKLASLFAANNVIAIAILDTDRTLMGCVGIFDRRSEIAPDEEELSVARTALNVLANRVKMRIYQQRLLFTQTTLEGIMDNTGIDIYVNDYDTHEILYVNKSMAKPYGGIEAMSGKKCWQALYTDKDGECEFCPRRHILDENGIPSKVYSWDYQRPFDGKWFRVFSSAFRWVDGRMAHVISSVDITESKNNELMIRNMLYCDTNTGIPNRRKLTEDFDVFVQDNQPGQKATFMFLDLDDFKSINDTLGHLDGDTLLNTVARYLAEESPAKGHAYRFGGDEFIIFVPGETPDAKTLSNGLLSRFSKGWNISGRLVDCGISIGVAEYPTDGTTYEGLVKAADEAMYNAKASGKGNAFFYHAQQPPSRP